MKDVFLKVLEIGISASILIGVILFVRQIFKKKVSYANICLLWLLVGIRLLMPFSVESDFSLIPHFAFDDKFGVQISEKAFSDNTEYSETFLSGMTNTEGPKTSTEDESSNTNDVFSSMCENSEDDSEHFYTSEITDVVSKDDGFSYDLFLSEAGSFAESFDSEYSDSQDLPAFVGDISHADPSLDLSEEISHAVVADEELLSERIKDENLSLKENVLDIAFFVWIFGAVLFLSYGVFSFIKLKRKISVFVTDKNGVRKCESINSPFVFGIIKPKIYMPFGISEENEKYIIAHEKVHIKRLDYLSKILAYVALSVYWFCPLVWVWFIILCKDIEYACDEKVVVNFDNSERKNYAYALLECSVKKHIVSACPISFGEIGVKDRVKNSMCYKKPYFWITIVIVILALVLSILFLTDPKDDEVSGESASDSQSIDNSEEIKDESSENISNDSYLNNVSTENVLGENSENTDSYASADNVFDEASEAENSGDVSFDDVSEDDSKGKEEDISGDDTPSGGTEGDITWKIENGVLSLFGGKAIPAYSDNNPAPWLARKAEIKEIVMSDSIRHIGKNAFGGCANLEKITFSKSLEGIAESAFKGCKSLKSLEFPKTLGTIYSKAFESCVSLKTVYLPENVTFIASDAFLKCENLSEITVSEKNNVNVSIDGVLYRKQKTHVYKYPSKKTDTSYEILKGVNYVTEYSFYDCDFLESITLPFGVSEIQKGAFGNCNKLKKVILPSTLSVIEEDSFAESSVSEIHYDGTRKQWLRIRKEKNWYTGEGYTVYCSDGNLVSDPDNKSFNMWLPFMEGMDYECYLYEFDGSAGDLVARLIEFGVVQSGTKVLSFQIEGDTAKIDLSKEFTTNMVGLTSETNIIEALANTIIDNFGVKKVLFTVEGKVLSTGHNTYDSPVGFTRYIKLYVPNEDFSGVEIIEAYCNGSIEDIISMLIMYKALPEGTKVLSYNMGDMYLTIDLSKEFGDEYFADPDGKGYIMYSCVKGTLQRFYNPPLDTIVTIEGKDLGYAVNG